MVIVPLTLAQANDLVLRLHRHHKKSTGHRFSLGAELDGKLVGAAIVGRPVARGHEQYVECEVNRLVTDGTPNACSLLYGACRRVAKEMGFRRIITYILDSEPGTSLKASGWRFVRKIEGRSWDTPSRRRVDKHPTADKQLWESVLKP